MSIQFNNSGVSIRDGELVLCLQSGDSDALAKLYDQYAPTLLGAIVRIIGRNEQAEGLLQMAFLEINGRIGEFDKSKDRLLPWMLSIARSLAFKFTDENKNGENKSIQTSPDSVSSLNGHSAETSVSTMISEFEALPSDGQLLEFVQTNKVSLQEAAKAFGLATDEVKLKLRAELKKYRQVHPDAHNK